MRMPASSSTGSSLFNGAKRKASLGDKSFLLPTFLCALIWDIWVRGKNRPLFLSEWVEQMSKSIASRGRWAADFRGRWHVPFALLSVRKTKESLPKVGVHSIPSFIRKSLQWFQTFHTPFIQCTRRRTRGEAASFPGRRETLVRRRKQRKPWGQGWKTGYDVDVLPKFRNDRWS